MKMSKPEGEPWRPHCVRCAIKHSLLLEGHMEEAIDRAVREGKNPAKWSKILAAGIENRKLLEDIYFSDETMVSLHLGFDVSMEDIEKALVNMALREAGEID